jgi:hypothetical protein
LNCERKKNECVKAESTEPSALANKGPTNQQRKKERKEKQRKKTRNNSIQSSGPAHGGMPRADKDCFAGPEKAC